MVITFPDLRARGLIFLVNTLLLSVIGAFVPSPSLSLIQHYGSLSPNISSLDISMGLFSGDDSKNSYVSIKETEAQKAIDTVVNVLRRDKEAQLEIGKLLKVTNILGFGSPTPGTVAVRFNASFQRDGRGLSAKPMPFGLGQTNQSEGRGVMVGQVKASVDAQSGRVIECTVFRDLGYGRAFNLKRSF